MKRRIIINCSYCGKSKELMPSLVHKRNFCNKICSNKWKKANYPKIMKECYDNDPEYKKRMKNMSQNQWSNRSDKEKQEFSEKVSKGVLKSYELKPELCFNSGSFKKNSIPWNIGKPMSDETKQKLSDVWTDEMRKEASKKISKRPSTKEGNKLEIKMQNELKSKNIVFETQKPIKLTNGYFHKADIFIKPNIFIECDGNYWHANPNYIKHKGCPNYLFYRKGGKLRTAKQIWDHDKRISKEIKDQGYKLIRFWEYDINNNLSGCIEKIVGILRFNPTN